MSAEAEKQPSVVRLVISIALIVLGAVVVWAASANWRRFEARYWMWKADRAAEHGDQRAIAADAHKRGFCLLYRDTLGVTTGESKDKSIRVYVSYRLLVRDIFEYHYVFTSADGGKTWRKESTTQEALDKSGAPSPDYEIRDERSGFSLWRKEGATSVLVRRFAGYPEFRAYDRGKFGLLPPEPEMPR
jgi:hypothetical protein